MKIIMTDAEESEARGETELTEEAGHTYLEIATNWNLWCEFADPSGYDNRDSFEVRPLQEKIEFLEDCFGPEGDR